MQRSGVRSPRRPPNLQARTSESTRSPFRIGQFPLHPFHGLVLRHNHLRNAVPRMHLIIGAAQIQQNHFDLSPVTRIDGRRSIRQRDRMLQSQPASGPDLRLITRWQLNRNSRGNQPRNPRLQRHCLCGAKVQPRVFCGPVSIAGQGSPRMEKLNRNVQLLSY
jgi:hypothetical protein